MVVVVVFAVDEDGMVKERKLMKSL